MAIASTLIRARPLRRYPIIALLLLLIFAVMLPYGLYLAPDLKKFIRAFGYEVGQDSIPRLTYHQDEKGTAMRMSPTPQLKTHVLPWRVSPRASYQYEDADYGIRNQPFSLAADVAARMPTSAEAIYILADGVGIGSGHISIREDEDGTLPYNKLQVNVRIYANTHQMIRATEVSYVQSHHREIGIKIHTPALPKDGSTQRFMVVNVTLPRSTTSFPLQLSNFRTHLPNFIHTVGDLSRKVNFKSIILSSSNQPMYIESLSARRSRLRTTNGLIEGTFNSSESLSLRTSNGPINADVKLSNDGKESSSVEVLSSDDEIRLRLELASDAPGGTGGNFKVLAKTSNKPIDVICPTAPLQASTQFEVQTSNSPATLRLPPSYEGLFQLHSTPFKPSVTLDDTVQDPYSLQRERSVAYVRERRGLASGEVKWVPVSTEKARAAVGSVSVKTSNAETRLFL